MFKPMTFNRFENVDFWPIVLPALAGAQLEIFCME